MKYIFVVFTLHVFSLSFLQAQSINEIDFDKKPGFIDNIKNDGNSFYNTSLNLITSPFHFDNEDFITTGIIIGATALSFTLDNPVRNNIRKIQNSTLDKTANLGSYFGNGIYAAGLSGILYLGGHIFQEQELRKTGLMLTEAIVLNGLITGGLKVITGRSRPYRNKGNGKIELFAMEFEDDENSLPSGHTSTAFTVATVLSERIDNLYASIALYSLAGLTAFERVYDDKHWISDTVLGAALGTVIGLKVVKLNSENENKGSSLNMQITPLVNSNSYGVAVLLHF